MTSAHQIDISKFLEEFRPHWKFAGTMTTAITPYTSTSTKVLMAALASRVPGSALHILEFKTCDNKTIADQWLIFQAGQFYSLRGETTGGEQFRRLIEWIEQECPDKRRNGVVGWRTPEPAALLADMVRGSSMMAGDMKKFEQVWVGVIANSLDQLTPEANGAKGLRRRM